MLALQGRRLFRTRELAVEARQIKKAKAPKLDNKKSGGRLLIGDTEKRRRQAIL
ncbi:hypothetical protein B4110_2349 [Parageobacillus toebii]|uniref:Uncharacterized protein n=1 Tax=Parageobacillus toebii TaxID=153151 RepID=A0A150N523_9BACL|nr:hypothetical protein B4110_2349 [Parageobacillus toebii]